MQAKTYSKQGRISKKREAVELEGSQFGQISYAGDDTTDVSHSWLTPAQKSQNLMIRSFAIRQRKSFCDKINEIT